MAAPPPIPLEALVKQTVLAATRDEQFRALDELLTRTYPTAQTAAVFSALRKAGPEGTKRAMEFVARMAEPVPAAILLLAAQVLQIRTTPVPLRLAVAGKLLASVPDTRETVGPIVRSVIAGQSRSRALERMIRLQSRVESCRTLDDMVKAGEGRVKWKCPKCKIKLPRAEFIRHLWAEHRLRFDRGAAYDPRKTVETTVNAAAQGTSAEAVEAAFIATTFYYPEASLAQVLQSIASRQRQGTSDVPAALMTAAVEQNAGLCPSCLTAIPDPIPPLPPPLSLGSGRLSGDGYAVEVKATSLGYFVTAETPDGPVALGPAGRQYSPRGYAVIATAPLLLVWLIVVALLPSRLISPGWIATGLCGLAWLLYWAVRSRRPPLDSPDDHAVGIAWESLAGGVGRSKKAVRFLTRLCRVSAGVGPTVDRVPKVWQMVEQAEVLAEKSAAHAQFLAAVQTLQAFDGVTFGKDKFRGLVVAFGRFVRGEAGAVYAEAVGEFALTGGLLSASDATRAAILLTAEAFEAGLLPGDILRIIRFLPWTRRLLGRPSAEVLRFRHAAWRNRNATPWTSVGKATSIFELTATSPATARRVLAMYPDAVLKIDLPDNADRDLGDTVLTPRGVIVGGKLLTDPTDTFSLARSPSGSGWWLVLGTEKLTLDRRLTTEVVNVIREWLKYWANKLTPQADGSDRTNPARVAKLLAAVASPCPLCAAWCVCRAGKLGEPWPLT